MEGNVQMDRTVAQKKTHTYMVTCFQERVRVAFLTNVSGTTVSSVWEKTRVLMLDL